MNDADYNEQVESVLSGGGTPQELAALNRAWRQDPGRLAAFVSQVRVHALLREQAGFAQKPAEPSRARRRPWVRLGLAAAALILLFGGALWALVLRPATTASTLLQKKETSPVPPAAASAAAAQAPEAEPETAATNAATSKKEKETVNVKTAAVTAAVAAAAIAPPLAVRAVEGSGAGIAAGEPVAASTPEGWLETRSRVDGQPEWEDWLETRSCVLGDSEGRQTWYLSTVPPPGTVYKLL